MCSSRPFSAANCPPNGPPCRYACVFDVALDHMLGCWVIDYVEEASGVCGQSSLQPASGASNVWSKYASVQTVKTMPAPAHDMSHEGLAWGACMAPCVTLILLCLSLSLMCAATQTVCVPHARLYIISYFPAPPCRCAATGCSPPTTRPRRGCWTARSCSGGRGRPSQPSRPRPWRHSRASRSSRQVIDVSAEVHTPTNTPCALQLTRQVAACEGPDMCSLSSSWPSKLHSPLPPPNYALHARHK